MDEHILLDVTVLVRTLAQGELQHHKPGTDIAGLIDQAAELAAPTLDYEEAAREAGWEIDDAGIFHASRDGNNTGDDAEYADDWKEACDISNIEPHEREALEHWAVSEWLADRLIEKGEKVDKDFAGMCVWASTKSVKIYNHERYRVIPIDNISTTMLP